MDSFWSKLLILGIVAAIGMFFIINVYAPQKAAQQAMADSTQQTVNAVKAGVDGATQTIVNSDSVVSTVATYCNTGNTINIIVVKASGTYTFTTSRTTTGGQDISTIVNISKSYVKLNNGTSITFTEQS
jgi:hypothetical protein